MGPVQAELAARRTHLDREPRLVDELPLVLGHGVALDWGPSFRHLAGESQLGVVPEAQQAPK
eukprot:6827337-Pyramimonas_sp.AAC.1